SMRVICLLVFFFSSRRRHTRFSRDWSSDVCSSDLPSDDDQMHLRSLNYAESYTFRPSAPLPVPEKVEWYSYFLAVCDQFLQRGHVIPPMEIAINGDVPLGAGLSSSAAFEVCAATLLNHVCHT